MTYSKILKLCARYAAKIRPLPSGLPGENVRKISLHDIFPTFSRVLSTVDVFTLTLSQQSITKNMLSIREATLTTGGGTAKLGKIYRRNFVIPPIERDWNFAIPPILTD